MTRTTENRHNYSNPETPADLLMDYHTGEIRNARLNLEPNLRSLVNAVKNDERFKKTGPVIVLSTLATDMIRKFALEANSSGKENGFSLRGIKILENDKNVFIGAYATPATWYHKREPDTAEIYAEKEEASATRMVNAINLAHYLEENTDSPRGKDFGVCHIHHSQLDENSWGNPSKRDYEQVERYFLSPEMSEYLWIVATITPDGNLLYTAVRSYRNDRGKIIHQKIKIVEGETYREIGKDMAHETHP